LLTRDPVLGLLGLLAGVFHMLNHSLYKSCLFLGAGAVYYRAGSRSLSEVGGLGRFMPVTALCAGTAALAIAGVPPLNGFASKWMIYATAVKAGGQAPWLVFFAIVAIFISLVTLASFIKYLAGAFMGSRTAEQPVREVPAAMLVPQVVLALTCVVFGLVPLLPLNFVHAAVTGLLPAANLPGLAAVLGDGPGLQMVVGQAGVALWGPLPIAAALVVLGLFSYLAIQRGGGAAVRDVPAWTCGEEERPTTARYPAASFYVPFKHAFRGVYPQVRVAPPPFPAWLRRVFDVDRWLYLPTVRVIGRGAGGVSRTHVGIPQVYLLWIVVGAVAVVAILLGFID
jgi:hydrogenase-4 component B